MIQVVSLDGMHDANRLAFRRKEVEPTSRCESVLREAGDFLRDGILSVEIVEEPAVELTFRERGLDQVGR